MQISKFSVMLLNQHKFSFSILCRWLCNIILEALKRSIFTMRWVLTFLSSLGLKGPSLSSMLSRFASLDDRRGRERQTRCNATEHKQNILNMFFFPLPFLHINACAQFIRNIKVGNVVSQCLGYIMQTSTWRLHPTISGEAHLKGHY